MKDMAHEFVRWLAKQDEKSQPGTIETAAILKARELVKQHEEDWKKEGAA